MREDIKQLNLKEMGRRIRNKREYLGMSREKLAEELGVSSQFINDIEYGYKGMSLKNFFSLSQILRLPADYLLAGIREKEDEDYELAQARDNVMDILCRCSAKELGNIEKMVQIYTDGMRVK